MKFKPMDLAFKYCIGSGVELGAAAHNSFDLPDCKSVAPSDGTNYLHLEDLEDYRTYEEEQLRMSPEVAAVDFVGDFRNLPADDGALDYIISSHVIEHEPNFIAAMIEADRTLKNEGVFFCIFPKRNSTPEDGVRALTTLQKVIADYENGITVRTASGPWRTHYSVFSLQSMIGFINHINQKGLGNWLIEYVEETDSKVGNGHTIVLRKVPAIRQLMAQPPQAFYGLVQQLITRKDNSAAVTMLKVALSFDFRNASNLHALALLTESLGNRAEGAEFLQQALVVNPENEGYRRDFMKMAGRLFQNPVL
ncbi:MAG TPA: methyltransferase domain-containing protein [Rhodocyclaceae bacterium]|jgi:ubiquinone/menaquinone biosynthesis C-methylase UbiE|nr:methyltransferase domain-containing protein [Rhodocyclaceae bacterium]